MNLRFSINWMSFCTMRLFFNNFQPLCIYLWIRAKMGRFSAAVIDTFPLHVESGACLRTHCQFGSILRDLQPARKTKYIDRLAAAAAVFRKISCTREETRKITRRREKIGKWHFSTKVTACQKSHDNHRRLSPHMRLKSQRKPRWK